MLYLYTCTMVPLVHVYHGTLSNTSAVGDALPDSAVLTAPRVALLTAPVLSRPQMRVLTRVLTYDNCTPLVAARVDAALRLLAVVPANRSGSGSLLHVYDVRHGQSSRHHSQATIHVDGQPYDFVPSHRRWALLKTWAGCHHSCGRLVGFADPLAPRGRATPLPKLACSQHAAACCPSRCFAGPTFVGTNRAHIRTHPPFPRGCLFAWMYSFLSFQRGRV
jgi:hypothetical protein